MIELLFNFSAIQIMEPGSTLDQISHCILFKATFLTFDRRFLARLSDSDEAALKVVNRVYSSPYICWRSFRIKFFYV